MKTTTVSKKKALSIPSRLLTDILAFAIFFCIWSLGYGILDALVGWLFELGGGLTQVLWSIASIGTFIIFVALPVYYVHIGDEKDKKKATKPVSIQDLWREEEEPQHKAVAPEVTALRNALTADINAIIANQNCLWSWCNDSTTTGIYVYPQGGPDMGKTFAATVHIEDRRALYADIMVNGNSVRVYNEVLMEAKRVAQAAADAPIVEFLKRVIPDAKWSHVSDEDDAIQLTSKKLGVKDAVCQIRRSKTDGHITSIDVPVGGGVKNIKNRATSSVGPGSAKKTASAAATQTEQKSAVETASQPQEPASPADKAVDTDKDKSDNPDVEKVSDSKMSSTIISRKRPLKPVDVLPTAEETKSNLLRTWEEPPVSDDILKRAAYQLAEYDALEISELAISAEENGESSFLRPWPEGLQTKKEAEYYAEAIVSRGEFSRADIDAATSTIRFYLLTEEDDYID